MTGLPEDLSWREAAAWVSANGLPDPPPWRDWPYPTDPIQTVRFRLLNPIAFLALRADAEQAAQDQADAANRATDRLPNELTYTAAAEARAEREMEQRRLDRAPEQRAKARHLKLLLKTPPKEGGGVSLTGKTR